MVASPAHRVFKDSLYAQLARIGKAIASPARLELLELLMQSERTVDSLATETGLSVANTSQHLQTLRAAGLIESRKAGLFVHYRLGDPSVFELCQSMRVVGERRLAELDRLVREHFASRGQMESISMQELLARSKDREIIVIDARPAHEYAAGHIAGAISLPIDELKNRLRELPKTKQFVAYCRGPYCIYADQAVEVLRASRRRASRLEAGLPEWRAAGFPTESS